MKEAGVRLKTSFGKHPKSGARMGIYSLAGLNEATAFSGRKAFPKKFREDFLQAFRNRCNICNVEYASTSLQLDHRVPYLIAGESDELRSEDFQPLCGSHQRSKSWSCEHCSNRELRDVKVCQKCYWAIPDGDYEHIATRQERRVDITWAGEMDVMQYQKIKRRASEFGQDVPTFLKTLIANSLQ
ncbi:MAG: hypothetical protein ACREQI_01255 [Candidatus Binataceae bacterium]